jgi:hypothetical protein
LLLLFLFLYSLYNWRGLLLLRLCQKERKDVG